MRPVMVRDASELPEVDLNFPHMRTVRGDIRVTFFAFAHLNPAAAQQYVSGLDPDTVRHHEMRDILRAPGQLVKAAPGALATFALAALIEKADPDDLYRRRADRFGPFGVHDTLFSSVSPGQGPFFELLEHAPAEGLRLVRGLVEHAMRWRREAYDEAGQTIPSVTVPFPGGPKTFQGGYGTYQWARGNGPSVIVGSALLALEAWAHRQIEAGRPFAEVLDDVVSADGSSVAFLAVGVDLVLSHWSAAKDTAWPLVATPELIQFEDARFNHHAVGADRHLAFETEPASWRVKRADLDARLSRHTRLSDKIGYYVFRAPPERLAELRSTLEQARNRIAALPDDGDPINGLRATADRAVHMTDPANWILTNVTLADGTQAEAHQYRPAPEEQARFDAAKAESDAHMQHLALRLRLQAALLDPAKSTPEIVTQGIYWAQTQPTDPQPAPNGDEEGRDEAFNRECDRRAMIMAAALSARDYEGADRKQILAWAQPLLLHAAKKDDDTEYRGNDQIEYSTRAIAAVGLIALYFRDQDAATRDALLRLTTHQHGAVLNAFGQQFVRFHQHDPGLVRSFARIVMARSIYARRGESPEAKERIRKQQEDRIEVAITAEISWLNGGENEPPWPEMPPWLSRPRRGIRIGGWSGDELEDEDKHIPELFVDEHPMGNLFGHLVPLTAGSPPDWLVDLSEYMMKWTSEANGPQGVNDRQHDHRPTTWNTHFFDFVGVLCVGLPHAQVKTSFLEPICRFKDDAFHEAAAGFLRGFDRATLAINTSDPEDPAAVRRLVSDRMRQGWGFKRAAREKGTTVESHFGDAVHAMFYHGSHWGRPTRPLLPERWPGLQATFPTLASMAKDAGTSVYVANLFLNLVESSPTISLLPAVTETVTAWCSAYGADANFWAEWGIGDRVCRWLEQELATDEASVVALDGVQELLRSLDVLIRSGVPRAREIEEKIVRLALSRKSA